MEKLFKPRQLRLRRGATIEYVLLLMVIIAAFAAIILLATTQISKNVASYTTYCETKKSLDDVGAAYIAAQGKAGCLDDFQTEGFHFEYTNSYLLVKAGDTGEVLLHVQLADADGDGVKEAVYYVYGT